MPFKVLTILVNGQTEAWRDDHDEPETFTTERAAEAAIAEYVADVDEAIADGFMDADSKVSREDFIIEPVTEGE